jgi:gamma-glutamyl hercynylcysteine S-oxide hydrolase
MCRHLAYLGPPIALSALLLEPPHSLLRQSWAPRDMRGGGTINADGFGVGWYARDTAPIRYRRDRPMWADENFARLAEVTVSGAVLAAVRSATPGMPVIETACAPFTEGPWLFSVNGLVAGWPDSITKLAEGLPVPDLLTLDAPTDAAVVWALVRRRLRHGAQPAEAVARTVVDVAAAAPGSRLNVLLTDGVTAVANTFGHSLSLRQQADAVQVASEPCDTDPTWRTLPDGLLVTFTKSHVDSSMLPIETGQP